MAAADGYETLLSHMDSTWMRLLDDTTMRLSLLGSLQAGNRLNTRLHYVYRNTWHARLCRSFVYTETREHTVSYVRQAVENLAVIVACAARAELPSELVAMLSHAALGACGGPQFNQLLNGAAHINPRARCGHGSQHFGWWKSGAWCAGCGTESCDERS